MADEQSVEQEEVIDPLSLFSEKWRQPVEGLAYLGQLTEDVEFCGHHFGLRTLLPQDTLAIGQAVQPYRNTMVQVDAFQAAHVGMALTSVDHDEGFCPSIGPDIDVFARGRLNWVVKNLYPPTVEFLWNRLQLLETTAALAIKELDRLSKGSQPPTLPPWLDSLIEQGALPDETALGTQPSTPSK